MGIPVLLHFEQASIIINEITGYYFLLKPSVTAGIIYVLIFANVILMGVLLEENVITEHRFWQELRNFALLTALFFCTPLLIGFGIYFVFWHSSYAFKHQIESLDLMTTPAIKREFIKTVCLFSLLSYMALSFLYWLEVEKMNLGFNLGILFLFIAIVTVPHSILTHKLYNK